MQVFGSMPRVIDRSHWGTDSTYDSANKVGSHPADAVLSSLASPDGEPGRSAAIPALRNQGLGSAPEKISDPRSSDALMRLRGDDGARVDHGSVFAAYGENS